MQEPTVKEICADAFIPHYFTLFRLLTFLNFIFNNKILFIDRPIKNIYLKINISEFKQYFPV